MADKKEPAKISAEPKQALTQQQEEKMHEATVRAESQAQDWRKRTRIDPETMRKPLVRR
jgi:hypothetical protein